MCVPERERKVKLGTLGAWQEKDGKGFSKALSINYNTKEVKFVPRARASTASLAKTSKLSHHCMVQSSFKSLAHA